MTQEEILQLDETALCLFQRLQLLYEDAHVWFQNMPHDAQGDEKFLRLQDISNERDRVSIDLCEHIAYVLLADVNYKTGMPGIRFREAMFIRFSVSRMNLQRFFEEARDDLHEAVRMLKVIG